MHQSDHFELENKKKILGKGHSHISKPLRIGKQDAPPQTSPSALTLAALSDNVFAVFASLYEHNQPASCVLATTSAAKHLDAFAGTRGTDSWLGGTDIGSNLVRICIYCFKCMKFACLLLVFCRLSN